MPDPSLEPCSSAQASGHAAPPFFPVSILKLVVLAICTLGLYELYWFYRNWRLVCDREKSDIRPFWRAVFAFFFCYGMFTRVRDFPSSGAEVQRLPAGPLAAGWIITTLLWKLPNPYSLLCWLAVLFIVPVQMAAIRTNDAEAPGHDRNAKFSPANWVTVGLGGVVCVLAVIGSFMPDT
jgi:hypothetical protein